MDCRQVLDRLDAFLDGRLTPAEESGVDTHLAECAVCREIAWGAPADTQKVPEIPPGLTDTILAKTSGRTCRTVRADLPDYVDAMLAERPGSETTRLGSTPSMDPVSRELFASHLDHCQECAALVSALTQLPSDLVVFAEARPTPDLVNDVRATTVARRRSRRGRWEGWRQALLGRSRLAWELGYVGAIVLWVVFGASWAPLRVAPAQVLAFVQQNPVQQAVERLGDGELWHATGGRAVLSARAFVARTADRYDRAAQGAPPLRRRLEELRDATLALDFGHAFRVLRMLGADLGRLWSEVWSAPPASASPPGTQP